MVFKVYSAHEDEKILEGVFFNKKAASFFVEALKNTLDEDDTDIQIILQKVS
jgi:hypothetical protein